MNQKIIKLVRQALNECVSTPVESVIASSIDDHGIVEIPNVFSEKFAELIVQECIDVCANGWQGEFTAAGISQCVSDLKEHFGVEE